ncbi:MAG: tetratricopeptide repeat protein [Thermomicrobiales bacterium]
MASRPIQDNVPADPEESSPGTSVFGHPLPPVPRPLSPIVGRRKELDEATALLTRGAFRLLTLTGPGGVGKTRLSLEIAHRMRSVVRDGVVFIDLSPVENPALVLPAIATTLGVPAGDSSTLLVRLSQAIGDAHLLLVLDNLEQVITAGVEIAALLARCPHTSAVVTSRMPLRVQGEQELAIPTFTELSAPGRVATNDAVELFVQRAQAARRDFALTPQTAPIVAEICARLDGLPLAIELAAARTKLFSPAALLQRLSDRMMLLTGGPRDLPSRLQTMRDAIQWSYDLLSGEDQAAFRRLALFSGSFSLDVAMGVIEPPIAEGASPEVRIDALDAIANLIDHSLILRDDANAAEPRFRMLETIRAYGIDELRAQGEAREVERRFVYAFGGQAAEAAQEMTGERQTFWLDQHDRNVANFRLALQIAIDAEPSVMHEGLGIASDLWRYWLIRGQISEGASWLERFLARDLDAPPRALAEAMNNHGNLLLELGQLDLARDRYTRSRELYEQIGNREGLADELNNLGLVAMLQGEFADAKVILEECLELRRSLGDWSALPTALSNLGDIATYEERYDDAERFNTEAYRIRKERGNVRGLAFSCHGLGLVAYYRGEDETATRWLDEGMSYAQRIDDSYASAILKVDQGMVAARRERSMEALELTASALHVLQQTGSLRMMAEAFDNVVTVALATGHYPVAARLLGGARALRDEHRIAFTTRTRKDFALMSARLNQALGEQRFVAAFDSGQAMDVDALIEDVLGLLAEMRVEEIAPLPADVVPLVEVASTEVDEVRLASLGLTRREREVLIFLVHGMSDKEIADHLSISPRTAMTHVGNVLGKLGVNRRASAATVALRDRLVDPAAPIPSIHA